MLNKLIIWIKKRLLCGTYRVPQHVCYDCKNPINKSDDDAHICIQCGGRNKRLTG